ncbi:Gfo/Idh/MocA family oxidoreductase [Alkalicoccobacillus plakortidis]|uniref:Gfo/Idh/MocA family oxidoreductase n=1 Tax=Alkalicoccobacillus plakortidis TaxID=444060 RepID=A0ABT0XPZ5_9BACI|nr:Gfo/Idh/MocA family oxidoreductase [Alkalicoccobacillus plakortidis]MCM2677978.1 Gfo/Idh/MocA family oxidoreductase [Alkalicoccobacillus plakortidis]
MTLEIVGTDGVLSVDALKEHSILYNDASNKIEHKPWSEDMDEKLVEDFISCIKEGRAPFISGQDGLRTLEVVKAAYEADNDKRPITLKRHEGV